MPPSHTEQQGYVRIDGKPIEQRQSDVITYSFNCKIKWNDEMYFI